jgi:C_GCAxxG_C_C family probable redox protein
METANLAVDRFRKGYSCSQAVFSALAERKGIDVDLALRIASGFGGGISRSGETCGCVTGAIMALGLEQRDVSVAGNKAAKDNACKAGQRIMREFAACHGSSRCQELLGCNIATPEGMQQAHDQGLFSRHCEVFVLDAVELALQAIDSADQS